MKKLVRLGAVAAVAACASAAVADPIGDATAGLDALNRGDNAAAIRLFTQAMNSGALSSADRELALVKRAEAYLASGDGGRAMADTQAALALAPGDTEAVAVRAAAQNAVTAAAPPALAAAPQQQQQRWGAVVGAWWSFPLSGAAAGASWAAASQQQAVDAAMAGCRSRGGGNHCKLANTWTDGCYYIASGAGLFKVGWGMGATVAEASAKCSSTIHGSCAAPVGGCN